MKNRTAVVSGHTAIVTGGNHGIGASTARILAEYGARVLVAYLRLDDPGTLDTYQRNRAADAEHVLDIAESELGLVDILVNNASGWLSDTFVPETSDWFGRPVRRVTGQTFEQQFAVDAVGQP